MTLRIDGSSLLISDVVDVGRYLQKVEISEDAIARVIESFEVLNDLRADNATIYGISTGCGELDSESLTNQAQANHQENIVLGHACGVGPTMAFDQARAMMLSRLNTFSKGNSGVSTGVIESLLSALNKPIAPRVPLYGSVGSSDLVPLAHMSLALIGKGKFIDSENKVLTNEKVKALGYEPLILTGRDGLALINGLGQTLALASFSIYEIDRLLNLSICASHLTIELITPGALNDQHSFVKAKNHETLSYLFQRLSVLTQEKIESKERSPLSLRYSHSVSASLIDVLKSAKDIVHDELNAVSDNPVFNSDGNYTNNSVNTSSQRIAIALDSLAVALGLSCIASERRIQQLIRKDSPSGLPSYLIHPSMEVGSNYGMMIMQYTAASLTAEVKARMQARSIQSIPVGGLFEDLNSNVNHSASNLLWLKEVFSQLVSIELLATMQGYDCLGKLPDKGFRSLYKSIRERVDTLIEPRVLSDDIEKLEKAILRNEIKSPVVINILEALSQNYS